MWTALGRLSRRARTESGGRGIAIDTEAAKRPRGVAVLLLLSVFHPQSLLPAIFFRYLGCVVDVQWCNETSSCSAAVGFGTHLVYTPRGRQSPIPMWRASERFVPSKQLSSPGRRLFRVFSSTLFTSSRPLCPPFHNHTPVSTTEAIRRPISVMTKSSRLDC